jgi:DNA-binding CsgD family transcriptional regulator
MAPETGPIYWKRGFMPRNGAPVFRSFKAQPKPITAREKQVIDLVCDGHSNAAIAQLLDISVDTAKRHLYHIFEKVGCESRLQLAMRYRNREKGIPVYNLNLDSAAHAGIGRILSDMAQGRV